MAFRICSYHFRRTRVISTLIIVVFFLVTIQIRFVSFLWTYSSRNPKSIDRYVFKHGSSDIQSKRHDVTNMKPSTLKPLETSSSSTPGSTKIVSHRMASTLKPLETSSSSTTGSTKIASHTMASTLKPTKIDMENSYYPFVNFSFVTPDFKPVIPETKDYMLVVLVNSGARGDIYRSRRNAIRETWGRKTCEERKFRRESNFSSNYEWLLAFCLGKTHNEEMDRTILAEAKKNNDIVLGDFEDVYINNIIKVYMCQRWISSLKHVRYILKTDDDVYVRIPATIDWLVRRKLPTRFYGGGTYLRTGVERDPSSKWAVSKKYFNETYFPPFNAGAFYILSTDVLNELSSYVNIRRPFHTDDAYIGVAARDLNIKVTHVLGFRIENNMALLIKGFSDSYLLTLEAFGHALEPDNLRMLHNRLTSVCKNSTSSRTW